ncbi:MAG: hypothetical protein E7004_03540 [Alphaproteobacteria bacterium]|nr:hypothetical protein [Alphaproteobacteria bacterium]
MKKIILDWIINFLMTRFAISAEATASISILTETQISELLEGINKEYNVEILRNDISTYIDRFGSVSLNDLSTIVFARVIA